MMANENWFNAFFVFPLSKLINFLTPYVGVALSVSIVTLLVHLITLIFTIKSTVMTQKMQVIQPEMNRITKKYEGKTDERSQMAQAQEMQRLYKENWPQSVRRNYFLFHSAADHHGGLHVGSAC